MAAIFRKLNRIDLAKKHLELALAIRKELQFNLDNFSKNLIEEFEIDLNNLPDSKKIWAQLKNVWEKEQYSALPWYQGKIILVMNNGYCGFVGLDNGNTYYFKRDHFLGNSEYITTGQNVKFQIILAINPKKDKANKVAVNVTPLDENNEPYPFTENRKKDKPESENVSPNVINDLDLEMKTEKSENEN
jgi:hypothetical protein